MSKMLEQEDTVKLTPDEISEQKIIIPLKFKEEICKIIWVKNNSFAVNFKGYGISFNLDTNQNIKDSIKIQYESEIGKSDFKVYPIFD